MIDPASMMKAKERLWLGSGGGAALQATVAAANVGEVDLLDGAQARDKPSLMTAIARALRFPDHFGHNWDALARAQAGNDGRVLLNAIYAIS